MARQRVRQNQVRKPDSFDDQLTPEQIAASEASSSSLNDIFNALISQIRRMLGTSDWKDAVPVSLQTILEGGVGGGGGAVVTDGAAGTAPAMGASVSGSVLVNDGATNPAWRPLTQDDILPAFACSLSGGQTVEVGATVANPSFTASYTNGPPTSATLSDSDNATPESLVNPFTSVQSDFSFQKSANNASTTFTLSATKGVTRQATAQIAWQPRVFWGVSNDAGGNSEAFIEALASSALAASRSRTLSVTAGSGEYIYYAFPASYGAATFTVGGFEGGFDLISAAINVTNANGVTQAYRLYRSTNPSLGATSVVVS